MDDYFNGFYNLFQCSPEKLNELAAEDPFSGYPEEPGGSVWASEGKALFASIRLTKPQQILEIGNFKGVSSNHILKAVDMNDVGRVTLLDISEQLDYGRMYNEEFTRILCDSVEFLASSSLHYDFYVIDGDHSYEYTKKELELIIANQKVPCWIWAHDYFVDHDASCQVRKTWDEMADNFDRIEYFKGAESNCGFVLAHFNPNL